MSVAECCEVLLTSMIWSLNAVLSVAVGFAVQRYGGTALHRASEGGHVECVRLLLDRGAGMDALDVSSWLVVRTHGLPWVLRGVWRALVDVCV